MSGMYLCISVDISDSTQRIQMYTEGRRSMQTLRKPNLETVLNFSKKFFPT